MKKYIIKNYIIKTFLSDLKYEAPFRFIDRPKFFNKYEPIIKNLLKSEDVTVFLYRKSGGAVYGGPFSLETEDRALGYGIIKKPNFIITLFCSIGADELNITNNLLTLMFRHLNFTDEQVVKMPYPTKKTHMFVKNFIIREGGNIVIKTPDLNKII